MATDTHAHDAHGHADPAAGFDIEKFTGGSQAMMIAGIVGVIGIGATLAAGEQGLEGYLTGYLYWLAIALGALVLMMAFHAAGGRWMTVLRRVWETMAGSLPVFALLFLPIALNAKKLFFWTHPEDLPTTHGFTKEQMAHLAAKSSYLNLGSFYTRAVLYFVVFIGLSQLFWMWSHKADESPSSALTRRMRRLGAGGLPILALALTFACFDWLLSLDPLFSSTMFGIYYFAGGFLSAICLTVIVSRLAQDVPNSHTAVVSPSHWHNLGKLMLAFTAFWAYIAFSQYMLIWIANLPEEITWYISRTQGAWKGVWSVLIATHFIIPFFTLLSRDLKRKPTLLSLMAVWLMSTCFLDTFWLINPAYHAEPTFHWSHLTALVGVGGVAIAFALFRIRGRYAVPVGDPYLDDSLRYTQP
ncbi:MAG: hypothetical protein JST92_01205 [Deltaproteobacteria bacterium]|nr:hypothetical protein [Deltaproteobacteria bacterium]